MKNPFLKRLIKDNTDDVLHSSAYAKLRGSGSVMVDQSFTARQRMEQSREFVRKYADSRVVNTPGFRAKKVEEGNKGGNLGSAGGGSLGGASGDKTPPMRKNPGIFR